MNSTYEIIDTPLPLNQNFKALKAEGLAYIQAQSGNEWTNLNAGDPGVTILDQVCYALTELGYCNDFSVKDILTGPDDKLKIKDQFYLPEEILTTSPLTKKDYRKYVIDGVDGIDNAIVVPVHDPAFPSERQYQVYLLIDANADISLYDKICDAVFYYLNKSRNLGETFRRPVALRKMTWCISGEVQIENKNDQYNILLKLQEKISDYIFPKVEPKGYYQSVMEDIPDDELFNGPLLKNGWITNASLGKKRAELKALELSPLIGSLPGVVSAKNLMFSSVVECPGEHEKIKGPGEVPPPADIPVIRSLPNEVLNVNVIMSRQLDELVFICNGQKLKFDPNALMNNSVGAFDELSSPLVYGKSANVEESLPQGDFRDINNYYSIQNTFPAIYGIGAGSTEPNASALQVAQSRQLKGYLTLFDQVLANQFSQLANIDNLFSFKNAMVGAPSDLEAFMNTKSSFEKSHLRYPVPYMVFSPTYFYQSLYNIPYIKPLLKNYDTFYYSGGHEGKDLDESSWTSYKNDPYNSYMLGLKELMTDPTIDYERRNNLLDHLLARHGESPLVIDALIEGSVYSGDNLQDKVIFKSLYLQNFGLLSYYRQKGYNYLGADPLSKKSVKENAITLFEGNYPGADTLSKKDVTENAMLFDGNTIDFIFNSEKINKEQLLTESDFINYSALELKLNLLFGLRHIYVSYLSDLAVKADSTRLNFYEMLAALREGALTDKTIKPAVWLIEKRKGFILIETALFWDHLDFNIVITADPYTGRQWYVQGMDHSLTIQLRSRLMASDTAALDEIITSRKIELDNKVILLKPYKPGTKMPGDYVRIKDTGYYVMVTVAGEGEDEERELPVDNLLVNGVELFFPDFIRQFNSGEFDERLNLFMKCSLSVTVQFNCHLVSYAQLDIIMPLFEKWHESLRYKGNLKAPTGQQENKEEQQTVTACTKKLVKELVKIYKGKK